MELIAQHLPELQSLQRLDLSYNPIAQGIDMLLDALTKHGAMKRLELRGVYEGRANGLLAVMVRYVGQLRVETVNLRANRFDFDAVMNFVSQRCFKETPLALNKVLFDL